MATLFIVFAKHSCCSLSLCLHSIRVQGQCKRAPCALGRVVAYLGNRVNIVPYTLSRTLFIGTGRTGDGPTSLRSLLRTAQAPGLARGSGVPLRGDYGEGIIRINTKEGTTH